MIDLYAAVAPLARPVTHEEVGRTEPSCSRICGWESRRKTLHVDGGYNAMGSPGRLLDQIKAGK